MKSWLYLAFGFLAMTASAQTQNAAPSLAGTSWTLAQLGPGEDLQSLLEDTTITLQIDETGTNAAGTTGCNRYRGTLTVQDNSLRMTAPISTRMACGEDVMRQEQTYLTALQAVDTFERTENRLELSGGGQRLVFVAEIASSETTTTTEDEPEITSANELDVEALNTRLTTPTPNPLTATLTLVTLPDAPNVQITREDRSENESVVTIMAEGLEDDSVAATMTRLAFARGEDGQWRVTSATEAVKCRRGEMTDTWVAGPCP
jgi:heat shock protein HslJ